jgi:hypothetical protein
VLHTISDIYIYKTKKKKIPPRNQKTKTKRKKLSRWGSVSVNAQWGPCFWMEWTNWGWGKVDLRWWGVQLSGARVVVLESDI